jgi:hypothetical protein
MQCVGGTEGTLQSGHKRRIVLLLTHIDHRRRQRARVPRQRDVSGHDGAARSNLVVLGNQVRVLQIGPVHSHALNGIRDRNLGRAQQSPEGAPAHHRRAPLHLSLELPPPDPL